jgi:hypothetical protein
MISPSAFRQTCRAAHIAPALLCFAMAVAGAQATDVLPFAPGERFEFAGRVHVGVSGKGSIWVDGPTERRGTLTWTLHSEMEGRLGFLRASDKSESWLDPVRFTSLRYTTHERHLLNRFDDAVDIFPDEKRWLAESGASGTIDEPAPLDELSFLFYLRTLPLTTVGAQTLARHYDSSRNPTVVTVIGREDVEVEAGRFHAVIVEMRVRDPRRYKGEGVIRITMSDDERRLLLRLESEMPGAGKATLGLVSYTGTRGASTASVR